MVFAFILGLTKLSYDNHVKKGKDSSTTWNIENCIGDAMSNTSNPYDEEHTFERNADNLNSVKLNLRI